MIMISVSRLGSEIATDKRLIDAPYISENATLNV